VKAAVVWGAGQAPVYADFADPVAGEGEVAIAVAAAALTPFTKMRASGQDQRPFPFIAGVDGVGHRDDGSRVFFMLPRDPYGSIADNTVVSATRTVALPDELDHVTAAAIGNPGASAWTALREHAGLVRGEVVLVNGATGSAGRLAVQIAKFLGAGKVIATGRNAAALQDVAALGADVTIRLDEAADSVVDAFGRQFADGVHIVLDYLWGASAEQVLLARARAGSSGVPTRFVQIGAVTNPNITLDGAVLRSAPIQLMGSGLGSLSMDRVFRSMGELFAGAIPAGLRIATQVVPIKDVQEAWSRDTGASRMVFSVR
jgi:NADPH:quinone reductase-like Zn-dependent oxidoreductase